MKGNDMTPARNELMRESAKRVRTALDKRAEMLDPLVADYDRALEHGDERQIGAAGVLLLVFASPMMDPVVDAVKAWAKLDGILARAEKTPVGGER